MNSNKETFDNPSPENSANICSQLLFCWVLPFFKYGYKKALTLKDIPNTVKDDLSEDLGNKLERNWEEEVKLSRKLKNKPSLLKVIFKTFYKKFCLFGIFLFLYCVVFRLLQPIVLAEYIRFYNIPYEDRNLTNGWLLALAVIGIVLINILLEHNVIMRCQRVGMRVRIACCSVMYRKLLRLSQSSLGKTAAGQVVNIMSNDVMRFEMAAAFFHFLWAMPLHFITAFFIMYNSVGIASVTGMVIMGIQAVPLQGLLAAFQGKLRLKTAQRTDYRVKLMNELTSGIQVIKMYAWEKPFQEVVEKARKDEVNQIMKTSFIKGIQSGALVYSERICLYSTLLTFVFLGNNLHGDIVFSLAQLFNLVQFYASGMFRVALLFCSESRISIQRIEEFLLLEEKVDTQHISNNGTINTEKDKNRGAVNVIKVNAGWVPNTLNLIGLNASIQPGTLCCIAGSVGCGKSSFLQLLLNELPPSSGEVSVGGRISYATQDPWLYVASVRDNILFGKPFIKSRYEEVIKVCALRRDLQQFSHGDNTLVGERGVSLSGGQRARINLARAVYADADVYLLDDPLSAVDTRVGKHLFQECIKKYLDGKTRILVTHQLQFLKEADMIIMMDEGRISHIGTFEELTNNKVNALMKELGQKDSEKEKPKEDSETDKNNETDDNTGEGEGPKLEEEAIEEGSVPASTYVEYWRSGTSLISLLALVFVIVLAQVCANSSDLWLRYWTNQVELRDLSDVVQVNDTKINLTDTEYEIVVNSTTNASNITSEENYNITIYTICIVVCIIMINVRAIMHFKFCMNSSKALHKKMFSCILQAPMRFFDTNPSGRILNRFSKDVGAVDELLPLAMYDTMQILAVLCGILMMVFVVSPVMIAPAIILGIVFYYFRLLYLGTAQIIKRFEGAVKAPVFSHAAASLKGLPVIRSSNLQAKVIKEFDELQDQHTAASFLFMALSEAFGLSLDVISAVFLAVVTVHFLFYHENTLAGNVGLVISQCLTLTGMLQYGIRQTAEVASNMVSVERVLQYTKLEKETDSETKKIETVENWPRHGKIIFRNMYLRYTTEDDPILKNLNIEIEAQEKVGIVGRTGAGKSSMIASLFRLAPIEGAIYIDDIDTSQVDLTTLRTNISIIPQEPVLFSGTIRYNLDPFGSRDDDALWKALENVELKHVIKDLNQEVTEGGSNFSVGQRQLICLARAIVRNNRILVMDEATANVDHCTDAFIQKTIRENFKYCTVLTIAHRLNTIMDSDKVLVMDAGQAVEFDHPHNLLQNPDGYLTKMVRETGPHMEAHLRSVAEEDFNKRYESQDL